MNRLAATDLREMCRDSEELALLDVREVGMFSADHLLLASCLPLSRLELEIDDLVPRRSTRVVLCDGGDDGLADRGAERLRDFGYEDVRELDGGVVGWRDAGFRLFSGVNVPSKAFGEFVEQAYETPSISAEELQARIEAGDDLVILDSRPINEFRNMSIPGGIDVPGAELVYRVAEAAPSPQTTVVVNCAGRTRSIIGAQSLINAGIENPVTDLRDGTMGWHLAGLELEHGQSQTAPAPRSENLQRAQTRAKQVAERFHVGMIDEHTFDEWRRESGERTLYVFDVRGPEDYRAGHLPGSRSAPGGQLVQATDQYMATRGARIVLLDDDGVRAPMTASWLVQMGWRDAAVLRGGLGDAARVRGDHAPNVLGLDAIEVPECTPAQLSDQLTRPGTALLDLAPSRQFDKGHIPGAWFVVRSLMAEARMPEADEYVLTSPDSVLARLAARELKTLTGRPVTVLTGGTAAWTGAGLPLEPGSERLASDPVDVWNRPYDRSKGVEQAMRDYLTWEVDLVRQVEDDGILRFETG